MPVPESPRLLLPEADLSGPLFVGIDLGGTNIKAALVDDAEPSDTLLLAWDIIREAATTSPAWKERLASSAQTVKCFNKRIISFRYCSSEPVTPVPFFGFI